MDTRDYIYYQIISISLIITCFSTPVLNAELLTQKQSHYTTHASRYKEEITKFMHTENNSIMAHFCRDTTLPKTVTDLISWRLNDPVSTAEPLLHL